MLKITEIIQDTGVPNYVHAGIPLDLSLNINEWEHELRDYHDQMVLQYLKFCFPLSLINPIQLSTIALQTKLSLLLKNIWTKKLRVESEHFYCSPILTQQKERYAQSHT